MNNKKILVGILALMIILPMISSYPIFVRPLDANNNTFPSSTFVYTFNFTTSSDCTGVLLSKTATLLTDPSGVAFINVNTSNITSIPSYLCEYQDGALKFTTPFSDQFFNRIFATNFIGDGSLITGILGSQITNDLNWVNYTSLSQFTNDLGYTNNLNFTNGANYYNSTSLQNLTQLNNNLNIGNWTLDKPNYYLTSNPNSYYNSTTLLSNTQLLNGNSYYNSTSLTSLSQLTDNLGNRGYTNNLNFTNGAGYYNSSNFVISDYYLKSNPNSYYNSTSLTTNSQLLNGNTYYNSSNFVISDYATNTKVDSLGNWSSDKSSYSTTTQANSLYYGISNPNSYYNSTSLTTNSQLLNGNTYYNSSNFVISDYYLASNPNSFYNSTSIPSYILTANEASLNVNSSTYWNNINSFSGLNNQITSKWANITNAPTTLSFFTNDLGIGNWTLDKPNYYTSTQTDTQITDSNTSMKNYVDGTFLTNSGDNATGQYNFNGGWTSNGLSVINGDLYAQTVYAVNFSGLNVNTVSTNGSLYPTMDNQFDLGNSTFRWKDLNLGGNAIIGGTATITGNLAVNTNNLFVDTSTGNVGIGTTTPGGTLDVVMPSSTNGNGITIRAKTTSGSGSQPGLLFTQNDGTTALASITTDYTLKYLRFTTNGATEVMRIDSAGNVGIGTTAPGYKLDVNGNVNIADGSYYKYGGSNALRLAYGTDTYYANTAVGQGAGLSATRVTTVGYAAGGSSSGDYQTAIGYQAGYYNSGTQQTAVGYYAGRLNTGGYQTAVGYYAGYSNTGDYQTTLGRYGAYSNSGIRQTAIGYAAGYSNTGGYQTAVGMNAGYLNTGSSQTAIGYFAGNVNTGNNVTGLGYYATYNNSGNDTVAIGYQAGKDNTLSNQFIVQQANINAVPLIQGDFLTGNVGIGTTNPLVNLNIQKSTTDAYPTLGTASGYFSLTGSSSLWGMYSGLDSTNGGAWIQVMRTDAATAYPLVLNPAGGNVGINTTTPQNTLNVVGVTNSTTGFAVASSVGFTGTCLSSSNITVVGGIITACA